MSTIANTKKYILLDSAGIRKSGQRKFGAENFAVFKTIQAAYEADVICIVVDGSEPLSHQDQVVAGIAKEAKKGVIVIANKSDLVDAEDKHLFERSFYKKYDFLKVQGFIWVSAVENKGIEEIWNQVDKAIENRTREIDPLEIRKIFNFLMKSKPPGKIRTEKRAVVYDLLYKGNDPHTFELLVKRRSTIDKNYIKFLENFLRKQFELWEVGIKIKVTEVDKKKING